MVNLERLEEMLNNALDAETPETLSAWLDAQEKMDADCGIIRNIGLITTNMTFPTKELDQLTKYVSYIPVSLDSDFNINDDSFIAAA